MDLNSPSQPTEFSHSNTEVNNKLQEVINKVLSLLEGNEELQKTFKKEFKSVFNTVTNDPEKLNTLLTAIDTKMTQELANLHDKFTKDPNFHSEEAKKEATDIIHKYTHMAQFALANSLPQN